MNQWRSDWKKAYRFEYSDTAAMFKTIGNGPIETDAQFAKVLYDKLGPGIYMLIAFNKGHSGFWLFWKVELTHEGFRKLPKTKQRIDLAKRRIFGKINGLKNKLEKENKKLSEGEKEKIKSKLHALREVADENFGEDYEWEKEFMKEFDDLNKRGPAPYLKQLQPVYKFHIYQDLKTKETNEVETNELWG